MRPSTFPLIALAFVLVPTPIFAAIDFDSSNHGKALRLGSEQSNADNEELWETQKQPRRELSSSHWIIQKSSVMAHLMTHINIVEKVILEVAEALNDCQERGVLSRAISNARAGRAVGRAFCDLNAIFDFEYVDADMFSKLDNHLGIPLLKLAQDYGRVSHVNDMFGRSIIVSRSDELREHLTRSISDIRNNVVAIFPNGHDHLASHRKNLSILMDQISQGELPRIVDVTEMATTWLSLLAQFIRTELLKTYQEKMRGSINLQQWPVLLTSVHTALLKLMHDTIQIWSHNMDDYVLHYKLLLSMLRDERVFAI